MSELYDKLAKLRDENRKEGLPGFEDDIFIKLLQIAFANQDNPDNLPNIFVITDVLLPQSYFESVLKKVGLNVSIELLHGANFTKGNTFKVTQIHTKAQG